MPCEDITEVLTMTLDADERLETYALSKRTCGRAVGETSLLWEWACGKTAGEVLGADVEAFLDAHPTDDEAVEFIHLKHFFALRSAMAALTGLEPAGATAPCALASVSHGPEGTEVEAHIRIDSLTADISACGRCCRRRATPPGS